MEHISPLGKAQHSGTYNGHLIEIMGGHAFFDVILEPTFYEDLLARCERLYEGINGIMTRLGFVGRVQGKGARFSSGRLRKRKYSKTTRISLTTSGDF